MEADLRERHAKLRRAACGFAWLALAIFCGPANAEANPAPARPLTRVAEVRSLTAAQAASAIPVRLTGIVTALSGFKYSLFFQDATAGIVADGNRNAIVHPGDIVEVTGTSGPGYFAPIVLVGQVRVLGHAPPPRPKQVTFADMIGGEQDSQWIEVEGIVHSAKRSKVYDHETLILSVDIGGGSLRVLLPEFYDDDQTRLIDAKLRFRGVCISDFNEKRQFVGVGLIVPFRADVETLQPAGADPFSVAATPIRDALQFGHARHRVKIEGVSTYQVPGRFLYVQQGGDGIRVRTTSTQIVPPGMSVEAVGFPVLGEYSPVLEEGFIRVVGWAAPVAPLPIQAAAVITQPGEFTHVEHDEQLVQIEGEVVESRIQGGLRIWTLRQDGQVFDASLPLASLDKRADSLGAGSILRLTGICEVHVDFDRNPTSFGIFLRSPQDIVVLRGNSWWTLKRLLALLAALGTVVLAGTLWVVLLRMRVTQLTRSVVDSEQRFRYLATHDGLTQLINRSTILETLEESLRAAQVGGKGVCVAILDLDHFKSVNDTYGHPAGDEVLREAARRLAASVRETDAVGRYGGEEFLIVFRNLEQSIGIDRCDVVRRALCAKPVDFAGIALSISCSIGISSSRDGRLSSEKLIAQADQALYAAKQGGRNRVECFGKKSPPPGGRAEERTESVAAGLDATSARTATG